ncbi:MAG: hypothetical protein AAF327_22320, partial [Cyanobacteria bacterium P01_A01_bin.37]
DSGVLRDVQENKVPTKVWRAQPATPWFWYLFYVQIPKYLDVIRTRTPNPVPSAARSAQDLEGYV